MVGRPACGRAAAVLALTLTAAALWTSGCTQLLSVGRNGVVPAVALEAAPAGGLRVEIQMEHYGKPGSGGGGATGGGAAGGQPVAITLVGVGRDLPEALSAAQAQTAPRLGFWDTDVVLLGQSLAASGVNRPLDDLLRDEQFSILAQVAVVRGQPASVFSGSEPAGVAEEITQRLIRSLHTDLGSLPIPFWRFIARVDDAPYEAAWAPAFAKTAKSVRADGTALFRGGRLSGFLTQGQTAVLGWLIKPGGFGALTFRDPRSGRLVTLRITRSVRRLRVTGPEAASVSVALEGTLQQGAGLMLAQPATLQEIEQAAAGHARRRITQVLGLLQAAGADVVGLGQQEREFDPARAAGWLRTFGRLRFRVEVTVHVQTSGRLS